MTEQTAADMRRTYQRTMWSTILVLAVISAAWTWFAFTPVPLDRARMTLGDVTHEVATLCPGETLTYTYTFTIERAGVYVFDASVWDAQQGRIVLFGDELRIAAASPAASQLVRHWVIPATYYDTLTDTMQPWEPGRYERHIAVTAAGVDTRPSIEVVPFAIRPDCRRDGSNGA